VPTFDRLPETGQVTGLRTDGAGRSLRLHLNGCRAAPSHTHFDQGALIVEADAKPLFIDRGIVRYDDARGAAMKQSRMHNVLTPVLADGNFPDQALPRQQAVIPDGEGDKSRFAAWIDLTPVWPAYAETYRRRIDSADVHTVTIHDAGRWNASYPCAFHLHALSPFEIAGDSVILNHAGLCFRIDAPWASHRQQRQEGIDFAYRPVWHLVLRTEAVTAFDLTTTISRSAPAG